MVTLCIPVGNIGGTILNSLMAKNIFILSSHLIGSLPGNKILGCKSFPFRILRHCFICSKLPISLWRSLMPLGFPTHYIGSGFPPCNVFFRLFFFLRFFWWWYMLPRVSFIFFIFFGHTVQHAGILVPWPGMEPMPPALGAWHLNHWTAREVSF